MSDSRSRIVVWVDDIKLAKTILLKPSMYRYNQEREHKLIEAGYIVLKNSKEHLLLKDKFELTNKNKYE